MLESCSSLMACSQLRRDDQALALPKLSLAPERHALLLARSSLASIVLIPTD